ncbi:MAG TPA: S8 family serine peptidase, partial [Dehalococcoidia bacterium]|nr:S8 family serine peptidase [Dehalococcoidia bacterium]
MVAVLDTWPWNSGPLVNPGATPANDRIISFINAHLPTVDPDLQPWATTVPVVNYFNAGPDWAWGAKCHRFNDNGMAEPVYDMASHGLFVAGIVQEMAPNAQLTVYRVLDDYGVGDLATVATAIQDAQRAAKQGGFKLVLNLSLGVAPPIWLMEALLADEDCFFDRPGELRNALLASAYRAASTPWPENLKRWESLGLIDLTTQQFSGMLKIVEAVASVKASPDVLLVASAGNDSFGDPRRMGPRVPAALDG